MDKYEISLWEDYQKEGESFFRERKIAVIGSNTMAEQGVQARALEPNLVENINGTHTLTFKMYYTYVDNRTGEKYANPFGRYLINERKVKVLWKNKWYDLVIKKCQEDTSGKVVTYTCTDLFINELSKQGYSLEFNTELQNNIGTVQELAEKVLEGSTWQYDSENSTPIIQRTEGPMYEAVIESNFKATLQNPDGDVLNQGVSKTGKILVFYDSIVNILNGDSQGIQKCQFLYIGEGKEWVTDINDSLVTNGDCYVVEGTWYNNGSQLRFKLTDLNTPFYIVPSEGVSSYRGKRLVKSQRSVYEPLLNRYVLVCKERGEFGDEVYEVATTEYTNPLVIINLFANPKDYTNLSGWIGSEENAVETFEISPKFTKDTEISTYTSHSYLKINGSKNIYNTGIQSNISYFTPTDVEIKKGVIGGIQKGEKYIFRFKAKANIDDTSDEYIKSGQISFNLYEYDSEYKKKDGSVGIFNTPSSNDISNIDNWVEYTLTASKAVSASEINNYGIFINSNSTIWIEDIQLFKYQVGKTSYDEDAEEKRINPGEVNLQSVVKPVYKYYKRDDSITKADELTYIYVGETENSNYIPVYNNYEKVITIEEKESNRFNILQSIAETAQAWVNFDIKHNDDGSIQIIDGIPQKYVYYIQEIGEDTGISFEYGIDLKTIDRTIDSDKLATKIIVKPNNNEFAPNGFCSIARSDQNYLKENFIINLDYYTQQNLLDKKQVEQDLYGTQDNCIGYYYHLHKLNKEYDEATEELSVKNLDLLKQKAQAEVYNQYISSAKQKLEELQSDIIQLAEVDSWEAAEDYAQNHANNKDVQFKLNACGETQQKIAENERLLQEINDSISMLEERITALKDTQTSILNSTKQYHQQFNNKYGLYLLEGTWQDEDYIDEDKYYLDALNVAYTSSRPQLSYTINVLRLSSIEEYSSKVFHLGDICYMQDREFFGYLPDKITPYKEKILVSEISSYFDEPEKDVLTIQNYKTRFDDLFQRIAATTQSLQYAEGSYAKAAGVINPDKTLSFTALQDTFDLNESLVMNSSNQDIIWDETGITLTNKFNSADKTKIIAGGIFITNDGGETWKNAIRGDGISADVITTGRLNTGEVYIYNGSTPSFRWDSNGITAYASNQKDSNDAQQGTVFNKFVRFDKYGIYGYDNSDAIEFIPSDIDNIKDNSRFGLTWDGFFLKSSGSGGMFEISTSNDLVVTDAQNRERIKLGRLNDSGNNYGIVINNLDNDGKLVNIFKVNNTTATIAGWDIKSTSIEKDGVGLYSTPVEKYYIKAGSNFGVKADGSIMAKAGTIGGWTITEETIQSGTKNDKVYTIIDSEGVLSGKGVDGKKGTFSWEIGKTGFIFNSGRTAEKAGDITSQIVLGPTTINNQEIKTEKITATGGSIGGCKISGSGISGSGWQLSSGGIIIGNNQLVTGPVHAIADIQLSFTGSYESREVVNNRVDVPIYTLTGTATRLNYTALITGNIGQSGVRIL